MQLATERSLLLLPVVVRIELPSWRGGLAEVHLLKEFIATTSPLLLDEPVVPATSSLRQQHEVKLPGAIIAASATVANVPLLTGTTDDFRRFAGLLTLKPHLPAQLPV